MFSRDRIGAIIFLIVMILYALVAVEIPSLDFDEMGVTPSTLPLFYSFVGIPIAILLLLLPSKGNHNPNWFKEACALDWKRALSLLGTMLIYGLTIKSLGFLISTILFLMLSFLIMGLRQPSKILLGAIPMSVVFWALLTQVLGIYLDPGILFR